MRKMVCPITGLVVLVPEDLVPKYADGGYKEHKKKAAPRKKGGAAEVTEK